MKAEVNKTVEVVLRLSEAEAKCLREVMRCITIVEGGFSRNDNDVVPERLVADMDETLFSELDSAIYKGGIGR